MGPYLFTTSALTGFFLFGSIYHFILWSRARRSWTLLLFAIVTFLSAIVSYALLSLATAQTTDKAATRNRRFIGGHDNRWKSSDGTSLRRARASRTLPALRYAFDPKERKR